MGYERTLPNGRILRVLGWFSRKNVTLLPWPAASPDLSPIENLWGIFKDKLKTRRFKKGADLISYLQAEWEKLDPELLVKLIRTMPDRVDACIKAKGSYFKIWFFVRLLLIFFVDARFLTISFFVSFIWNKNIKIFVTATYLLLTVIL